MHRNVVAAIVAAVFTYGFFATMPVDAHATALKGLASYYKSGRRTANGERFNPMALTAAHRSLPFGTRVKVTQVKTGRSVVVRINDRGPFVRGRIIDLSLGAARVIGLNRSGVAKVELAVLRLGTGSPGVDQMQTPSQARHGARMLTASLPVTDNIRALAHTSQRGPSRPRRDVR